MGHPEQITYHQAISLPYRYTAGDATTAFLRGLAERVVVGSRCHDCELVLVPARPFCPSCSGPTGDRVEVSPQGSVVAHTVEPTGRVVGLIRLDGADTSFPHVIAIEPDEVTAGMRVSIRWAANPVAEVTAIEAFEVSDD